MSDIVGTPETSGTNIQSSDAVKSTDGALAFYAGVMTEQANALREVVLSSGVVSDELQATDANRIDADNRLLPEDPTLGQSFGDVAFPALQRTRAAARQGRGLLAEYAPETSKALIGHLFAIEAMADVELADMYCSGIPLSTVDYNGDFTLRTGSPTDVVYQVAIALFDSALVLSSDSAHITNFALVGKARAQLALGEFTQAAQTVQSVPTDFQYRVEYRRQTQGTQGDRGDGFFRESATSSLGIISVATSEGIHGLPYATSGDWRTDTTQVNITQPIASLGFRVRAPLKYDQTGNTPIILASGIEARLIEAEAALTSGDTVAWLQALNALRDTCTPSSTCSPVLVPVPVTSSLGPLSDPGSDTARVTLLFNERAAWLYLTGHRQGDLRRLIREYGRSQDTVFPTGPYLGPQGKSPFYGTNVTYPVPGAERMLNSSYTGCINREA
jgi:hypothetical protein